jgi:transmembrane sensor
MKTVPEEAAELILRLHEEPTRKNRKACMRFLQRSPQHVRALFNELLSFYRVETPVKFGSDELIAAPEVRSRPSFTMPVPLRRLVLTTACMAVVAFVFTHLSAWNGTTERAGNRVCTGIGEVRSLSLEDGSTVELTTRTCVEVLVSATKREVHLLQGEALFTVQHNEAIPFSVLTRYAAVDDLGTQFRVYQHEDETDVGVLQGEVGIRARSTPRNADRPVHLSSGEGATVVSTSSVVTISPEKLSRGALERALAWRQGALEFHDDSLRRAVSEINRYNVRQLMIVDPAIENLLIGGRFRYSDFDTFVQDLTYVLRIHVDESDPNILKLSGPQSGLGEHHKRHKPAQRVTPQ